MATIAENLQTIKDSTAAIKQSIINKGGTISGNITTWASAIDGIETGGGEEVNTLGEVMVDKTGNGIKQLLKIVVDDNVTVIGGGAYYYCETLEEIVLHDMITMIGNGAFQRCGKLVSMTIPPLVNNIGSATFSYCVSLANFFIHDNVESIGAYAFQNCTSLRVFAFPANVNKIEAQAFDSCAKLFLCDFRKVSQVPVLNNSNAFSKVNAGCQFVVPDALYDEWIAATNWSTYADRIVKASEYVYLDFADPVVEALCAENFGDGVGTTQEQANMVTEFPPIFQNNTEITSFDEFERFENVTSIKIGAFDGCSGLKTIKIPNILNNLAQYVFANCISLEKVEISNNSRMSAIGFLCFDACRELTSINIPSGVTTIGFYAFRNCISLTTVTCRSSTPPTITADIFPHVYATLNIYVPDDSVDTYKSATNWSKFADQIKPLSEYQPITE